MRVNGRFRAPIEVTKVRSVAELRPLPAIAAPTNAKLALIDPFQSFANGGFRAGQFMSGWASYDRGAPVRA